jgi:hypothetical protein
MQETTLTLAVDHDHDGTPTNEVFTKIKQDTTAGRSVYKGADHTAAVRNLLSISAREAIPSGDFKGVAKSSLKFTQDLTVPNAVGDDIVAPEIAEVTFSLPVGTTAASAMHLRERVIAALNSQAFIIALTTGSEV